MAGGYTEELVYTASEDGFTLEGVVIRPADGTATRPVAVIWVHGLTGKFYGPSAIRVGRELAGDGYTIVSGNNRGHDFGTMLRRADGTAVLGGGGWECFDEAPRDVAAWIGFAESLGFRRIVLFGHSLGALKVVYYQALRQDPRVAGLIAGSPPVRAGRLDPTLVAQSERMVAEGRGQDLLPWGTSPAGAGTHSAQTYLNRARTGLDVYGLDTPEPAVSKIRCPLLALYGTDEAWVGGAADLDVIKRKATASARVETAMIDGADHVYTGHERDVARVVSRWLGDLS